MTASTPEQRRPEPAAPPASGEGLTLQSALSAGRRGRSVRRTLDPDLDDRTALFRELEGSRRFHRDTGIGRIFHPGAVSFRENVRDNSLHITVVDDRVSAHVDRVSPLGIRSERSSRYALGRVALHNVYGMASDLGRLLRGRQGDHRCELDCEWVSTGADGAEAGELPVLDPEASPWSVHLEVRVAGRLDDARMTEAFAGAVPEADVVSAVVCPDDRALEAARVELQARAVPVTDRAPLRAVLAHHPGGDVLMLNVNHAAADAPGSLQVIDVLGRAYAGRPSTPSLDFLAARDLPVRPAASRPKSLAQRYRTALESVRDALARPILLRPDGGSDEPGHEFHLVTVDSEDPASLGGVRDRDRDNDVLVAALHLAISVWNADHGAKNGGIAVLVPVDLRNLPWADHVVGNFSVTARISTAPGDRSDPTAALAAVTAQTARNIRTRTGHALIDALDRNGLLPLWARQSVVVLQPLTANHLLDSAVLSYVGRIDEPPSFGADAGDTTELWLSTPARMPHGLSIGAVVLAGRLHLTFRYPRRLFGAEAVRRFAECYVAQLRLVATAPLPSV